MQRRVRRRVGRRVGSIEGSVVECTIRRVAWCRVLTPVLGLSICRLLAVLQYDHATPLGAELVGVFGGRLRGRNMRGSTYEHGPARPSRALQYRLI